MEGGHWATNTNTTIRHTLNSLMKSHNYLGKNSSLIVPFVQFIYSSSVLDIERKLQDEQKDEILEENSMDGGVNCNDEAEIKSPILEFSRFSSRIIRRLCLWNQSVSKLR